MSQYEYKPDYRRNLPHIQPPGATLFVTFRLAGSIPTAVLHQLQTETEAQRRRIEQIAEGGERLGLLYDEEKRHFGRWDEVLDNATSGPFWLRQREIAEIVVESLHFRDGRVYDLDVFCLMPNHGHTVFTPLKKEDDAYYPLQTIMHSLKRHTARRSNEILGREGQFWQRESYDHVVRNRQEWERIVKYVLNNPVKAGLVASWEEWPWTYLKTRGEW